MDEATGFHLASVDDSVDPQFCPPSTCPIRYLFDTLQLAPWWPISTHATYLS